MIGAVAGPAAGAMPLGLFEAPPPVSMTRRANEPWDGSQQSNSMSGWERSATLGRHDGQSAARAADFKFASRGRLAGSEFKVHEPLYNLLVLMSLLDLKCDARTIPRVDRISSPRH